MGEYDTVCTAWCRDDNGAVVDLEVSKNVNVPYEAVALTIGGDRYIVDPRWLINAVKTVRGYE